MVRQKHQRITKNIVTDYATRFQREELKFFIDNHLVSVLIPDLLNFMERDHYSVKGPYPIYSIYFDTIDWQAFYSKLDGNERRQKFRIRSYVAHPQPDDLVYLEIKEKLNGTVFKRRTNLPMKDAEALVRGEIVDKDSPIIDEWRFAMLRNSLRPKILNTYRRTAYHSEQFQGLRVTIDQDMHYAVTQGFSYNIPTRLAFWSHRKSVIEVKFDRYVPAFIVDMIRKYNLTRVPVSKYCDSVISHYLLS